MDDSTFNVSPYSSTMKPIFPGKKGILLFYNDGSVKELYGREHVMLMQDIGYWYIDNWQDFLLNFSYNGIIVMMIEYDTSLVYLPKDISKKQKESLINYLDNNIIEDNKQLLNFYVMRCLEVNDDKEQFTCIERNDRGMIREINGKDITVDVPFGYKDLCNYLENNDLNKNRKVRE